jgi:acyl-CoA thioesterase FadM
MDVIKLSKRSVTSRFTLYRGETDERCAVIILKQAAIDTTDFKGIECPDDIHALFTAHLKTGE